ncbi:MAG: iron ABC transporter permease [Campylobacterota bacterium]|nr:iron ABC transporter permease [Campylobacterota bacterium]
MHLLLIFISLITIALSPFFGQIDLSLVNIIDSSKMEYQIFWELRVPRTILAFCVGAILALSGLVFQTLFRNPMSTPFTLGVASGATLFTAIAIVLGFISYVSFFAFLGSLLTIVVLFIIAKKFDSVETSSLLLVGIALSFFYSACLMVLFFISDLQESYEIVRFTMGSLDIVGFDNVYWVIASSIFLLTLVKKYEKQIHLLLVSYEFAKLKGVDVKKTNYILLFSVSIVVGICVSITGPIGFIGLIVPHIIKTITKKSANKLIFPIFFYGGVFLVLCDIIARNLGTTSDIPIGVITSFLGAPFFIYLIMKRKKV